MPSDPQRNLAPRTSLAPGHRGTLVALLIVATSLALTGFGLGAYLFARPHAVRRDTRDEVRTSAAVIAAIRDLVRLDTAELHVEKVIDLTDRQSPLFGLVDAEGAVLLVASGDVTIGIDLSKLGEENLAADQRSGELRVALPVPEILSVRLDDSHTLVYARRGGVFAQRGGPLDARVRKAALATIERAALDTDVAGQRRRQIDQSIVSLFGRFGFKRLSVSWQPADGGAQRF